MPRNPDPDLSRLLLDAATLVFARDGYGRATVEAVAATAGFTKGAVYARFASKEELFFAALDAVRGALRDAIRAPAGTAPTGAADLAAVLTAFLGFHFEDPDAARLLILTGGEVAGRPTGQLRSDAREDHRGLRARLRQALVRGTADGTLDVHDPALAAFLLAAGAQGVVAQWLAAPADVDGLGSPASLADAMVEHLRTGVSPLPREEGPGFIPPLTP